MSARQVEAPTLDFERRLLAAGCTYLAAMDEVGRGSLAGPVCVGVVVIDARTPDAPEGVRDSKLLTPRRREALVAPIREWALVSAVGYASNAEIDLFGIIPALRLAGLRALAAVTESTAAPDGVLLDGSHDWLSGAVNPAWLTSDPELGRVVVPRVRTMVKADMSCAAVAAASVLAKVERDEVMNALDAQSPHYGWSGNKGYASPGHIEGLRNHGASPWHRVSWSLPGLDGPSQH